MKRAVAIAVIAILGFGVYANSLSGQFIWDDEALVRDNAYIRNPGNLAKIFTGDIASGAAHKSGFYRPLQMLTYMIDYSFSKLESRTYHLTNVILHILAALSLYWFINSLFGNSMLSFFVSVLFVVHPVHTGAVSYVSGRADSLALLFMLLTFVFYVKGLRLAALSYALALLSKETALILPLLLLLRDGSGVEYRPVPKGDRPIFNSRTVPIFIITGAYVLLRLTVLRPLLSHVPHSTTLLQRLPGFFVAITSYIRLLFFPFDLHMEYGNKIFSFSYPGAIVGMAITAALLAFAFIRRKKDSLTFFSITWFFIALMPVSNLYPINAYMAEHWLYLPSIGFFILAANGLKLLYEKKTYRIPGMIIFIAATTGFSYLTIKQNTYWKDPVSFYEATLKHSPSNARVLNRLGMAHDARGERKKAVAFYKQAIAVNPSYPNTYVNLGSAYKNMGNTKDAILAFEKAIQLDPGLPEAYNNLGIIYSAEGRHEKAMALYEKAIEVNPQYGYAYNNLANAYKDMGKLDKAIPLYKKALDLVADKDVIRGNLERATRALNR